jgi:hypothetical protein
MPGIKEISLSFLTAYPYLVWPALIVLLVAAFFLYRRTNPPLPLYLRIILAGLRMIAVAALVLALLEPVLSVTREYERPPRVTMLADHSASMNKLEAGKSRRERMDSLTSSASFVQMSSRINPEYRYFGGNLATQPALVDPDRTALADALYELDKQQLDQPADLWMLFSDGNTNSGREPTDIATTLNTPIVTIDMAMGGGGFDVGIADLTFNPITFVGQPSEIVVKLHWQRGDDRTVNVELLDGNRVVDQKRLKLTTDDGLGEVALRYIPEEPGQTLLRARAVPIEGEETTDNNQRFFAVKVLKSKLLVLLASSAPDYEVGFLKRALEQSDKYEVEFVATGGKMGNLAGNFPSRQTALNRYDLVILHDPDPRRLSSRKEIIESYLSNRGGALWVLMGEKYAASGPAEWMNRLLPFSQSRRVNLQYVEFNAEPAEGDLFHPAVRLADDQSAIRAAWMELPPFQKLVPCDQIAPGSVILAWAARPTAQVARPPVLGYRRVGPGKVLASAAMPFWTWSFVNLGFGAEAELYHRFLEGTVTWLTVKDDFDPIRISPEKEVFTRGETVRFDGYAFDLGYRPIPGVTGAVKLRSQAAEDSFELDLLSLGEGKYSAEFLNVAPGRYDYEAHFEGDQGLLKRAEGQILVEAFSLEELDQSGNAAGLHALASRSGGKAFKAETFDEALAYLDLTPVAVMSQKDYLLWGRTWLLIVFLSAVSVEWLLRKINQLI